MIGGRRRDRGIMIEPLLQHAQRTVMPIGCCGGKLAQTGCAKTPHEGLASCIVFSPYDRRAISVGASAAEEILLQTLQPFGPALIRPRSRWEPQIVELVIGKQGRIVAGIALEPEKVLKTALGGGGEGRGLSCDIPVEGRRCTDHLPFIGGKTFQDRREDAIDRFLVRWWQRVKDRLSRLASGRQRRPLCVPGLRQGPELAEFGTIRLHHSPYHIEAGRAHFFG